MKKECLENFRKKLNELTFIELTDKDIYSELIKLQILLGDITAAIKIAPAGTLGYLSPIERSKYSRRKKGKDTLEIKDMKKGMIYPNCSEIVWKINGTNVKRSKKKKILDSLEGQSKLNKFETDTATYPNSCLSNMIWEMERAKNDGAKLDEMSLVYVDNCGGGGNWDYVEKCFDVAMDFMKGKIGKSEAESREDKLWDES
jgi:hypothetical protein